MIYKKNDLIEVTFTVGCKVEYLVLSNDNNKYLLYLLRMASLDKNKKIDNIIRIRDDISDNTLSEAKSLNPKLLGTFCTDPSNITPCNTFKVGSWASYNHQDYVSSIIYYVESTTEDLKIPGISNLKLKCYSPNKHPNRPTLDLGSEWYPTNDQLKNYTSLISKPKLHYWCKNCS